MPFLYSDTWPWETAPGCWTEGERHKSNKIVEEGALLHALHQIQGPSWDTISSLLTGPKTEEFSLDLKAVSAFRRIHWAATLCRALRRLRVQWRATETERLQLEAGNLAVFSTTEPHVMWRGDWGKQALLCFLYPQPHQWFHPEMLPRHDSQGKTRPGKYLSSAEM